MMVCNRRIPFPLDIGLLCSDKPNYEGEGRGVSGNARWCKDESELCVIERLCLLQNA